MHLKMPIKSNLMMVETLEAFVFFETIVNGVILTCKLCNFLHP